MAEKSFQAASILILPDHGLNLHDHLLLWETRAANTKNVGVLLVSYCFVPTTLYFKSHWR